MARRKSANNPSVSEVLAAGRKADEPDYENQSQEAEAEGAQAAHDIVAADREAANDNFKLEGNGQASVSKADAVREALAQGLDSPGDIVDYLKSRHGIEMTKQMASSYKAQQRAREAKLAGGEIQPRQSRTAATQTTGIPAGFGSDVRTIKDLLESTGGVDELTRLVDSVGQLAEKYGTTGLKELIQAFA